MRVQDTGGLSDTQSFNVTVVNTNDPPTITSSPITTATEDQPYSYDVGATDPDAGDVLTYSLVTAPGGMTIDPVSGLIEWTPTGTDVGDHSVTVPVQDVAMAEDTQSFTITVNAVASGPKLAHGVVTSVSSAWQTVTLSDAYTEMVVVATPRYNAGSGPGVVRIHNVTATTFDVRVDNVGSSPFSGDVHYVAVEAGVYDEAGFKLEARTINSNLTSENNNWNNFHDVGYLQSYTTPVVVGQVMSTNDPDWSVFYAQGSSRTSPPSSSVLRVGKHVGEDPDTTRATETIGFIVIDATQPGAVGDIGGDPFVAGVGTDIVRGVENGTYQYTYATMPNAKTVVLSQAGMDGGDGGWAVLRGSNPLPPSAGTVDLAIDEDQLGNFE